MRRFQIKPFLALILLITFLVLGGCGSDDAGGSQSTDPLPSKVGVDI